MKQVFIIGVMLIGAPAIHAQTSAVSSKWEKNSTKTETAAENDFSKTSIKLQNRKMVFAGLPQMSKPAIVNITNNEGELVKQSKITPPDNVIDLTYLDKGTYFVNITYKKEQKKGFVVNL